VTLLDLCGTTQVWKGYAHYAASKAGLAALTRLLALEWAPEVRVNGVAPGAVLLKGGRNAGRLANRIPLGRIGTPEDVARAVLFLAKEPFITGEILTVDGGGPSSLVFRQHPTILGRYGTQTQTTNHTEAKSEPPAPVKLTDKAAAMVKETIEREGLQGSVSGVAVVGGGCSGFQYSLDIEKDERPGDMVFEVQGVKCFVDPMSSMYLLGVEVDYVEGQFGQSGSASRTRTPSNVRVRVELQRLIPAFRRNRGAARLEEGVARRAIPSLRFVSACPRGCITAGNLQSLRTQPRRLNDEDHHDGALALALSAFAARAQTNTDIGSTTTTSRPPRTRAPPSSRAIRTAAPAGHSSNTGRATARFPATTRRPPDAAG